MSDDPTRDEVLASIVPRSDQINADDLLTGPITVTIEGVRRGDKDQPIIVDLVGHDRGYRPCKSMRRVLIAAYSDTPKKWVGQRMTLFCDPEVTWAGVKVGGIRISHLSGIDKTKTFMLTKTRGKKAEVVIHPITTSPEDQANIDEAKREIKEAATWGDLQAVGAAIKNQPVVVQDAVRAAYGARVKELKPAGGDS
jgi:hypothetical protein